MYILEIGDEHTSRPIAVLSTYEIAREWEEKLNAHFKACGRPDVEAVIHRVGAIDTLPLVALNSAWPRFEGDQPWVSVDWPA